MQDIIKSSNTLAMSSREIADLVGSRHDSVKRTIERLAAGGVITQPPTVDESYKDASGRTVVTKVYRFEGDQGKRDSIVVVAQLCPEFTARLVDRWQELEARVASHQIVMPDFSNPADAARAWAEQYELQQAANEALAIAAPKVEFVDRYVDGTGLKGFRQVCKLLGAKENDFRAFLQDAHIMYRLGGEWVPYSEHVDAGRFQVKTGQADNGHNFNAAKFTAKGIEWIAGKWAAFNIRGAA